MLALCLLCGLQVNSRLYFGNDIVIPNHGYVDLGLIRRGFANSVQCRTDLSTCCTSQQGNHRGQWYLPDGQPVTEGDDVDFYQRNRSRVVDLRRRINVTSPTGIFRCEIPTIAVNEGESVYVGLYTSEGKWLK